MLKNTFAPIAIVFAFATMTSIVALADDTAIDADVLDKVQYEAAVTTFLLYQPGLDKPFVSQNQNSEDTPVVLKIIFEKLLKANPGRGHDIEAVINAKIVPTIFAQRDNLFCHRKQRYYEILLASVDRYLKQTNRSTADRKQALSCNCLAFLPPEEELVTDWIRLTVSYVFFQTWDDIIAAGLTVPKTWIKWSFYDDADLSPKAEAGRELESALKLSAACGAAYSTPFPLPP